MFAMTIFGYTLSVIWFFVLLLLWIVVALLPASIARNKGRSFLGWFMLSLFFWWITLFVAIFMKDRARPSDAPPL